MKLAISCLGMAIHTQYSMETWKGYSQLRFAQKFAGLLADDIRKELALNTFIQSLKQRDKQRDYVLMLKQVHGSFDWIPKKVNPEYYW